MEGTEKRVGEREICIHCTGWTPLDPARFKNLLTAMIDYRPFSSLSVFTGQPTPSVLYK